MHKTYAFYKMNLKNKQEVINLSLSGESNVDPQHIVTLENPTMEISMVKLTKVQLLNASYM